MTQASQLSQVTTRIDSFLPAPRIVKPRTRRHKKLPVIAIVGDTAVSEHGLLQPLDHVVRRLPTMMPTLIAKQSAADFLGYLDKQYSERFPTSWQWRVGTHERDICRPDGIRVASRVSILVHYFGWKGGNFHKLLDPVTMYGHRLDEIWPDDEPPLTKLLQWAVALRDFCDENGMEVRPTIGGMSAQFLTDRRFYPNARRKVPSATNERAREALPGNHYVLRVHPTADREFTALYLDQHRAHHYHARTTILPAADSLYAYGHFRTLDALACKQPPAGFHGLYYMDLQAPVNPRPSHWITNTQGVFVFSNELEHLLDMGYTVKGIYAAWGSFNRDTGLARYARWAETQLDRFGDPLWLKPLLLATYGTLATKPKIGEAIFKMAKQGEPLRLKTGQHFIEGKMIRASKKLEPRVANVLHRGMIEAATRSESVGLGQWLYQQGHAVLAVYADAVIVRDDPDLTLPKLPEPWRCKTTLNHLRFINQQAFESGEMTKLPGVSYEMRKYRGPRARNMRNQSTPATQGQPVTTDKELHHGHV